MTYPATTFIIGAGASVHAGAPLMKDFLSEALKITNELTESDAGPIRVLDEVFRYQAENDGIEHLLGCDLTNIEDLFSLLDLEARVIPSKREVRDALVQLMLITLQRRIRNERDGEFSLPVAGQGVARVHSTTLETLVSLVANRPSPRLPQEPCNNAIISLNYDTLIERAMAETGVLEPDYALEQLPPNGGKDARGRVPLLKLHGSANWRFCQRCKEVSALDVAGDVAGTPTECCNEITTPLLAPPSWDKDQHREVLQRVWEQAYSKLTLARRWVFIGTSLPATDNYLRYLFALALKRNMYLRQVVIVDPGDAANVHKLFEHTANRIELTHRKHTLESALGSPHGRSILFADLGCVCQSAQKAFQW